MPGILTLFVARFVIEALDAVIEFPVKYGVIKDRKAFATDQSIFVISAVCEFALIPVGLMVDGTGERPSPFR
jgi:hypothetical protein